MSTEAISKITEPIRVLASFSDKTIKVHFFNWRDRIYKVESMNLFHIEKDGDTKRYHFAVSAADNSYQISYDPTTLHWQLEEAMEL